MIGDIARKSVKVAALFLAAVLSCGIQTGEARAAFNQSRGSKSAKPAFVRRVDMSRVDSGKVSVRQIQSAATAAFSKIAVQSALPARGAAGQASTSRQKAVTRELQALAAESSGEKGPSNEGFRKIVDGQKVKKAEGEAVVAADSASRESGLSKSVGVQAHEIGRFPGINENLAVNPRELYARAHDEAAEALARASLPRFERLYDPMGMLKGNLPNFTESEKIGMLKDLVKQFMGFGEVTGSLPIREGRHLNFSFAYPAGDKVATVIYVDIARGHGTAPGEFNSQVSIHRDAPVSKDSPLELAAPVSFTKGLVDSPDSALDQAQKAFPELGSRVSFSLKWDRHPVSGDTDLVYRFYDEKGNEVAVNGAHTGEVRMVKRGEPPAPSLWSRLSSIFRNRGNGAKAMAIAAALMMTSNPASAAQLDTVSIARGFVMVLGFLVGAAVGRFIGALVGAGLMLALKMTVLAPVKIRNYYTVWSPRGAAGGAIIGALAFGYAGARLIASLF